LVGLPQIALRRTCADQIRAAEVWQKCVESTESIARMLTMIATSGAAGRQCQVAMLEKRRSGAALNTAH
jgi:hypothetical protein